MPPTRRAQPSPHSSQGSATDSSSSASRRISYRSSPYPLRSRDPSGQASCSKPAMASTSYPGGGRVPPNRIPNPTSRPALHGHEDAHEFMRLFQCPQCSKLLVEPFILPCGNTVCKACIPELHDRQNYSYSMSAARRPGFECPIPSCGYEHAMNDCAKDVTLSKVVEILSDKMANLRQRDSVPVTEIRIVEKFERSRDWADVAQGRKPTQKLATGGRLIGTYDLIAEGSLNFDSSITYETLSESPTEPCEPLDVRVHEEIRDGIRAEMDCQVDACLFHEAVTTTCGHSYCRPCLARVFDHTQPCPTCRRPLAGHGSIHSMAGNARLREIMEKCWPELIAARAQQVREDEEAEGEGELNVPLFVCSLSFPTVPTFLHVFEPRYRLMMRRAMESGRRTFGMLGYNYAGADQPGLGRVHYLQCGTLLRIERYSLTPDGRSMLECTGISRFKVLQHGALDGYLIGRVEKIEDVSAAEEERREAHETATAPLISLSRDPSLAETVPTVQSAPIADTAEGAAPQLPASTPALPSSMPNYNLDRLSTRALMQIGHDFVRNAQASADSWRLRQQTTAFGDCPDDPALFPWWFAAVIPVSDEEKYRLLPTTSVRERLKIVARWVRGIERSSWYSRRHDAQCEMM